MVARWLLYPVVILSLSFLLTTMRLTRKCLVLVGLRIAASIVKICSRVVSVGKRRVWEERNRREEGAMLNIGQQSGTKCKW